MKWFEYNTLYYMLNKEISFGDIAEHCQTSVDAVAMMIARGNPQRHKLEQLAEALGVTVEDLEREG